MGRMKNNPILKIVLVKRVAPIATEESVVSSVVSSSSIETCAEITKKTLVESILSS